MKKDNFKKVVDNLWPKTKRELEKAIEKTKKMITKGESYIKAVSARSVDKTRKISLSMQREKLCYTLGRNIAKTPKSKWGSDKKIGELIKDIKTLDKEIRKIK